MFILYEEFKCKIHMFDMVLETGNLLLPMYIQNGSVAYSNFFIYHSFYHENSTIVCFKR